VPFIYAQSKPQMKNISFWPALSVVLIGINLFLIFLRFDSNMKIDQNNIQFQELQKSHKYDLAILSWSSLVLYEAIGHVVDQSTIIRNIDNELMAFKDIYEQGGIWVFRYFNASCASCYEESVGIIREQINNLKNVPFVVMTDFSRVNEFRNFVTMTHFSCDIYTTDSLFKFTPEESDIPYLLHIDTNGVITNCFVILKDQPRSLIQFLDLTFSSNEQ